MIDIKRPSQKPVVVIRAASGHELSNYEKRKLEGIEERAQENKIEVIRVNNQQLQIDPINKEVRIDLGGLAFKSKVGPEELSADELFFIKCELNEDSLNNNV